MVDAESVVARLARLAELLGKLDGTRAQALDRYLASDELRAATERRLQLAEQLCIDVGAHIVAEINAPPPADYASIFSSLADAGTIGRDLAARMMQAARQRNLLVHAYLELDPVKLFESLDHLDDFRAFAAAVQRFLDAATDQPQS